MSQITVDDVWNVVETAINSETTNMNLVAPPKIINRNCPICKSEHKLLVCRKGGIYYWRCNNCGLVYIDRLPNSLHDEDLSRCFNPIKFIKNNKSKFIVVPNASRIRDNTFIYLNGSYCGEYKYLYTKESMKILSQKVGFSIEDIKESDNSLQVTLKK